MGGGAGGAAALFGAAAGTGGAAFAGGASSSAAGWPLSSGGLRTTRRVRPRSDDLLAPGGPKHALLAPRRERGLEREQLLPRVHARRAGARRLRRSGRGGRLRGCCCSVRLRLRCRSGVVHAQCRRHLEGPQRVAPGRPRRRREQRICQPRRPVRQVRPARWRADCPWRHGGQLQEGCAEDRRVTPQRQRRRAGRRRAARSAHGLHRRYRASRRRMSPAMQLLPRLIGGGGRREAAARDDVSSGACVAAPPRGACFSCFWPVQPHARARRPAAMAAAGSERGGWGTLEGLVARALEPVLRRWLRGFRREQLRLDGLACELFALELNASVRVSRLSRLQATLRARRLAARSARADNSLCPRLCLNRSCTRRWGCRRGCRSATRAWTACGCRCAPFRCLCNASEPLICVHCRQSCPGSRQQRQSRGSCTWAPWTWPSRRCRSARAVRGCCSAARRDALTRAAQRATLRSVARATAPAGRSRWLWADREGARLAPVRRQPR